MKNIIIIILTGLLICVTIMFIDIHNKSEQQHNQLTNQQQTIKSLNKQLFIQEQEPTNK